MFRRLLVIAAAAGALFGISTAVVGSPVKQAAPTPIVSPVNADLLSICLTVRATNGGLCLYA